MRRRKGRGLAVGGLAVRRTWGGGWKGGQRSIRRVSGAASAKREAEYDPCRGRGVGIVRLTTAERTGTGDHAKSKCAWGATPEAPVQRQSRNRPDSGRFGHRRSSTCRARSGRPQEAQAPLLYRWPDRGRFGHRRRGRQAGAPRKPEGWSALPASGLALGGHPQPPPFWPEASASDPPPAVRDR